MKRLLFLLVLFLPAIGDCVAVHTLQVTIGASVTQVSPNAGFVRQVIFQNNAAHTMRVGDANTTSTRGALLSSGSPGGSMNLGANYGSDLDLSTFWVAGTQNDVLDVIYTD